jgi:hypothetical protein
MTQYMDVPVNVQITLEDLLLLESRINSNKDTIDDYKTLDSYVSKVLPKNYFLTLIQNEGMVSFESLEVFRRNPPPGDPVKVGRVKGTLLGLITFLKTQIK